RAVGKLVGPPSGTAIDDDPAGAKLANRADRQFDRPGEYPGLQAKAALADKTERLVDVVIGQKADDRSEHFVTDDLHVRFDAGNDCRFDLRPMPLAAGEDLGAAGGRFVDPGFDALC